MRGRVVVRPMAFVLAFMSVTLSIGFVGGLRQPLDEAATRTDVCTYPGHEPCRVDRDMSCDVGTRMCLPHQYGWSACRLTGE